MFVLLKVMCLHSIAVTALIVTIISMVLLWKILNVKLVLRRTPTIKNAITSIGIIVLMVRQLTIHNVSSWIEKLLTKTKKAS